MNNKFGRDRDYRDDRFRNDPQYTRGREPDGGFWERGEEDRVLRSPDQEFETSGSYRQPGEDYNQGRGSARYGSGGYRTQLTDYSSSGYDRNREGAYGGRESAGYGSANYGSANYGSANYGSANYGGAGRFPGSSSRGGFAGRGPKGYVRTDERIREEVCDRLSWNDEVDATDITVLVENGEVTLEGSVATRHMKRLAEDVAEDVSGVLDVHNTIRVQKPILTELKEKLTGEDKDQHYANTGTKTTGATSTGGGAVRNGVT